jgi:phosphoribosylformimino-5-aminoimidazole carboxamide ribotide isomerase
MHVLPVIDLKGGVVVRGVGGRRDEYRPVVSPLCAGPGPLTVARAFADHFGLRELYLADLDALAGAPPARAVYARLADDGFLLWVDAGLRDEGQARALARGRVHRVVAGSETLAGAAALARMAEGLGERLVFSLDLRDGRALAPGDWGVNDDPRRVAAEALACGARRMIVLDLARVGTGGGAGTEELIRHLAGARPQVEVYAGGGVRGRDDLARLKTLGARGALIASALHDGRLTRADLAGLDL